MAAAAAEHDQLPTRRQLLRRAEALAARYDTLVSSPADSDPPDPFAGRPAPAFHCGNAETGCVPGACTCNCEEGRDGALPTNCARRREAEAWFAGLSQEQRRACGYGPGVTGPFPGVSVGLSAKNPFGKNAVPVEPSPRPTP